MRVKAISHVGDKQPFVKEASVVLIEDDNGTVIAVAVDLGKGPGGRSLGYCVAHADDPDFNSILQQLGISSLTICEDFSQRPLEELMSA
jgi:hypothetical protein